MSRIYSLTVNMTSRISYCIPWLVVYNMTSRVYFIAWPVVYSITSRVFCIVRIKWLRVTLVFMFCFSHIPPLWSDGWWSWGRLFWFKLDAERYNRWVYRLLENWTWPWIQHQHWQQSDWIPSTWQVNVSHLVSHLTCGCSRGKNIQKIWYVTYCDR